MALASKVSPETERLASTFSTRVFKALSAAETTPILPRLQSLVRLSSGEDALSLGDAFDKALDVLSREYRSEYVYKNELVSKLVFGKHSPRTSSALLEQPMGRSCADLLVVNGTSTIYEIKTDLDDFSRLSQQLTDYRTRSEFVNVVVSDSRVLSAERYLTPEVGLLAVGDRGRVSVKRPATSNLALLDPDHVFQLLRTDEALALLKEVLDYDLDVPRGHAWTRAREVFLSLPLERWHPAVVAVLRTRGRPAAHLTTTDRFPISLRALAYSCELSARARGRVLARIEAPILAYALP